MKNVVFEALPGEDGNREGEDGWRVLVDGVEVIPCVKDMDIAYTGFDALWDALGIDVKFDFE
jgi:hypothetical protein